MMKCVGSVIRCIGAILNWFDNLVASAEVMP